MKTIMHVDMDAFFASIEQRDNPEWKGKPVIVGAKPGNRGVVSAASYEARKFGVRSAMPINQAYARCPSGIFVRPRMDAYSAESYKLMEIFTSFSPSVERISVDEAFIDMTGTERLWGKPRNAAEAIAERIRLDRSLTCSIGIAPNKFLAKLASDLHKPQGITETPFDPEKIMAWLAPMPISRVWGVGKVTEKALKDMGITSFEELQRLPKDQLTKKFGKSGDLFYDLCRGIDARDVEAHETAKSISREFTFNQDSSDPQAWKSILLDLCDDVGRQARKEKFKGRTVFFTYRKSDFSRHTSRSTLGNPTNTGHDMYATVLKLLEQVSKSIKQFRLIGVGLTNFSDPVQTELFEESATSKTWEKSEVARDAIEKRFGDRAIFRGTNALVSKPHPSADSSKRNKISGSSD
jgi:DNA polymerase IV